MTTDVLSITDKYVKRYKNNDKRFLEGRFLTLPALGTFCDGGLPEWSLWYVASVYDCYMYSGRKDRLQALLPYVEKLLENCKNMMNGRGLYSQDGAWHLIEWALNDLYVRFIVVFYNIHQTAALYFFVFVKCFLII